MRPKGKVLPPDCETIQNRRETWLSSSKTYTCSLEVAWFPLLLAARSSYCALGKSVDRLTGIYLRP
jgi:hypothetical protein